MLSAELIQQIKLIELRAGTQATEQLMGEYRSAFHGRGMEFEEVREYMVGDDIRTIDWNVTARTGQPYVKIFREERQMTLLLCIDVSSSQGFRTHAKSKLAASAELGAVLAYLAIRTNDKVGLLLFSDRIETYIPPKKGRSHIWRIIKEVLTSTNHNQNKKTNLKVPTQFITTMLKKRGTCFILSDFWQENVHQSLERMAIRHDVVWVKMEDPFEYINWSEGGLLTLEDSESGARFDIDLGDRVVRASLQTQKDASQKHFITQCRKLGLDGFTMQTNAPIARSLSQFLRRRDRFKKNRRG